MRATIQLSSVPQKANQLLAWALFASTLAVVPTYLFLLEQGSLPELMKMEAGTFLGFKIINAIISFYCAFTLLTGRSLYQLFKDKVYAQPHTMYLSAPNMGRQAKPASKAKAQTGKSLLFHNGELSLVCSEAVSGIINGDGPAVPKVSLTKENVKSNPAPALQRQEAVPAGI